MSNHFTINYKGNKTDILSKIRMSIGKGLVSGNELGGSFRGYRLAGEFEGSYTIAGNRITINISKKPFLVSYNRIKRGFEKALRNKL
ncbi:hypothetical protein GCM10007424_12590 [Flavobacterium suaedae]|uniref:Uncharacterized protein n=1 Tax=Flavobacterium suaedae TaxID=1767027 RepID=A0ABQ1JR02_9FLAO|nr:hypothetical protein [Flavobacterium suaedae]GGB74152.1 hypothetical protein GCM10007424_12590 [Flavobacterium suaedae]